MGDAISNGANTHLQHPECKQRDRRSVPVERRDSRRRHCPVVQKYAYECVLGNDECNHWLTRFVPVNIMDSIMFDAQRHGRVSFYMVGCSKLLEGPRIQAKQQTTGFCRRRGDHDWISRCSWERRHHYLPIQGTRCVLAARLRVEGLYEPINCQLQ